MKIRNCWTRSKFRQSSMISWNHQWFEGKLISLFRQIYHLECKYIGFSSPIPKPVKREQRWGSALNIPQNVQTPGFSENDCSTRFFSTQTEIKTFGALSKCRCGCRKELKLRNVFELFKRKSFDSHSEWGRKQKKDLFEYSKFYKLKRDEPAVSFFLFLVKKVHLI